MSLRIITGDGEYKPERKRPSSDDTPAPAPKPIGKGKSRQQLVDELKKQQADNITLAELVDAMDKALRSIIIDTLEIQQLAATLASITSNRERIRVLLEQIQETASTFKPNEPDNKETDPCSTDSDNG